MAIRAGDHVIARSWAGEFPRRAVTGVVDGMHFPVVWVCTDEEWAQARREDREPDGLPWPADDVSAAPMAPACRAG